MKSTKILIQSRKHSITHNCLQAAAGYPVCASLTPRPRRLAPRCPELPSEDNPEDHRTCASVKSSFEFMTVSAINIHLP